MGQGDVKGLAGMDDSRHTRRWEMWGPRGRLYFNLLVERPDAPTPANSHP